MIDPYNYVFISYFILTLELTLVADKKECSGSEIDADFFNTLDGCASHCKGKASMFAFGTNDYGNDRCNTEGCRCLCETSATEKGTCEIKDHDGYRLYRYPNANNSGD